MNKITTVCCLLVVLISCQTFQEPHDLKLTPSIRSAVDKCPAKEISLSVLLSRKQNPIGSINFDWIFKPPLRWEGEVSDFSGQSFLRIKRKKNSIKFFGRWQSNLKLLNINEDGFYYWDKDNLFLKEEEIMCILSSSLPNSWLDLQRFKIKIDGSLGFVFKDRNRKIFIWNKFDNNSISTCGLIKAPFFWGLFYFERYSWCFNAQRKSGFFSVRDTLNIEWKELEDFY